VLRSGTVLSSPPTVRPKKKRKIVTSAIICSASTSDNSINEQTGGDEKKSKRGNTNKANKRSKRNVKLVSVDEAYPTHNNSGSNVHDRLSKHSNVHSRLSNPFISVKDRISHHSSNILERISYDKPSEHANNVSLNHVENRDKDKVEDSNLISVVDLPVLTITDEGEIIFKHVPGFTASFRCDDALLSVMKSMSP